MENRRPVLLVHGLFATHGLMRPLAWQLRRKGHEVHLARELRLLVTGDVRVHAEELERSVTRVVERTGAREIDVVGASQGGLVALWWAHTTGWERIGRLVAVGSPFKGAPAARFGRFLAPIVPGLRQVQPGGPFSVALEGVELRKPVTAISVTSDPVCPPNVCALPGMDHHVLRGGLRPVAHQTMMYRPDVVRAVHGALVREVAC